MPKKPQDAAQQVQRPGSGIRDNRNRGSVADFLRETIKPDAALSIVSAYFTIYAFEELKKWLGPIKRLRFLYGEPRSLPTIDPVKSASQAFGLLEEGLSLANVLQQKRIARECAAWIREQVDIRSVTRAGLLHGKLYHITNGDEEAAILGSSNFTLAGLGLKPQSNNVELNLVVDNPHDRHELKAWFNELWHDKIIVKDVKQQVLDYLAQLYADNAPKFIYYKMLFHVFESYLAQQAKRSLLAEEKQLIDTTIWQALYEFQRDGVRGALDKILAHNGCIIADSVGLGKTYEALAVIKYFELRNERVLVLCPKKLRENWTVYQAQNNSDLNPFKPDRFSFTVLSHTDLSREQGKVGDLDLAMLNWSNYDLVVLDEAHNFRNHEGSRYKKLLEGVIKGGVKTKVLLLSATPVNNNLTDLHNLLALIAEGKDGAFQTSLGIKSLRDTLNEAQRTFNEWSKESSKPDPQDLANRLGSALFALLDALTIARSRKHIQTYYSATIQQLGGFSQRLKPISIFLDDIDRQKRFMSYDRLSEEISKYQLSLFNPSKYVLEQNQEFYNVPSVPNFDQATREHYLIGMMKVNFLKRLESSVHSFTITLDRTIKKIESLEEQIKQFQQAQAENPDLDFEDLGLAAEEDEELQMAFQVGKKLKFKLAHLDVAAWLEDLQRDKEQVSLLHASAAQVTVERDAKLAHLKALIAEKVKQPTAMKAGKLNRKVLVFTAFADTATYLYDNLQRWAKEDLGIHVALVTGTGSNQTSFGSRDFMQILTNFAPLAKKRSQITSLNQTAEIDLLIATDCIAEGQNLQDCDYLINYDIHWNPVRIIQRFGRIDRIGSPNAAIQLVNFWPTPSLEKYLNLRDRVEARMALVDLTATGADNPLATQDLITQELTYRDQQLLRFKAEIPYLEDLDENFKLDEFSLDEFRLELLAYLQSKRELLEKAPFGMFAVVPPNPAYPIIGPGVIFCLQQKETQAAKNEINPLHPFYLVYVRENGEVRLSFGQPRQILEIWRTLAAKGSNPYQVLCRAFDRKTDNGKEMTASNKLLLKAVESIAATFQRRMAGQLLTERGAKLLPQTEQTHKLTDFNLVTWLVILARDQEQ